MPLFQLFNVPLYLKRHEITTQNTSMKHFIAIQNTLCKIPTWNNHSKYSLKHSYLSVKVFVFGQRCPQLILNGFFSFFIWTLYRHLKSESKCTLMSFLDNILQNQIKIWKSQEEMKLIRKPIEQKVRQVHGRN